MAVLLGELARDLGLEKSSLRKYVLAQGFAFQRLRTQRSGGQVELALTDDEATQVRARRQAAGFVWANGDGEDAVAAVDDGAGFFYIIQVLPDIAPNRVKLGFAQVVEARLDVYRTVAPEARVVKAWRCRRVWEPTIIASLTRSEVAVIGIELFVAEDMDTLLQRGDEIFALLPYI